MRSLMNVRVDKSCLEMHEQKPVRLSAQTLCIPLRWKERVEVDGAETVSHHAKAPTVRRHTAKQVLMHKAVRERCLCPE